jgi:serpin B
MWTTQFDAENTHPSPFMFDNGTTANVPTMHGLIPAKSTFGDDYKAIELFYGRKNFSMVIVVPDAGIVNFTQELDAAEWLTITENLDSQSQLIEMDVSLPKFSFEYEKRLNDQLAALGMTDAFNPVLADLSGIADAGLFVSFVKQNTFVDVNEEGTEAAAVTTIGVDLTSIGEQFIINKPFLFAIREQTTNTILFIGQVFNP